MPPESGRQWSDSAATGGVLPWRLVILWLIPVVLAALVYAPIVDNYFWGDDFFTLFRLRDLPPFEYLFRPQGSHLYAATGAVFWAGDRLFGPHPRGLFCFALLTHLLNVALLFAVIRRLAGSDRLACLGAAIWGTSPVLEASLGWLSVYGHVLVATTILAVLLMLARLADGERMQPLTPLAWAILLVVGATSFGVGIGIALAMPAAAWLIVPPGRQRLLAVVALVVIAVAVTALYLGTLHYFADPGSATAAGLRRIWVRVVGFTIHLFGYSTTRALSGTFSHRVFYPSGTAALLVAAGIALLVVGSWLGAPPTRRRILGVLVLALGGYGLVAAGRAAYFGGGAASGRVDRYHYVGLALVTTALCIGAGGIASRVRWPELRRDLLLALALGVLGVGQATSGRVIDHHLEFQRQTRSVLEAIDRAIDAAGPNRPAYVGNEAFAAMGPLFANAKLWFPGWSGVFVIFYPHNIVRGHRVLFVERDPAVIDGLHGRRTAGLLVGEIPGAPHAANRRDGPDSGP